MGLSSANDRAELVNGGPSDLGRRFLVRSGLAASILALWQTEPFWAPE